MAHQTFDVEMTDLLGGEANYSWVRREVITVPELIHYGYNGGANYEAANKRQMRAVMRRAKAALGITGWRGVTHDLGDTIEFRPSGGSRIVFITLRGEELN